MYKDSENIVESLVHVNRVAKVVKGGRIFSFAAVVVVGDRKGRVGYGTGKAREAGDARAKATKSARNNMFYVNLSEGRTIHHDIYGTSGAARVLLKKAQAGKGVIAGGPLRAVFDCLGIQDIVAKSLGSSNANLMIAAAFDALRKVKSPKNIANRRGKMVSEIFPFKNSTTLKTEEAI